MSNHKPAPPPPSEPQSPPAHYTRDSPKPIEKKG